MYGKGAYSLSKDLGISVKEADSFLKTYLDTFPKVDSYMKDCIAHAKDKGYVETLFGRRLEQTVTEDYVLSVVYDAV